MKIVVTGFAAALTAMTSLGAVAPAYAQYQPPPNRAVLPPFEVITIIRSMGFDPTSRPVLRGPVYAVSAVDDADIPVRVLVDARSGNVVRVTESGPGRADAGGWPGASEARRLPPESVPPGMVYRPDDEDMAPPPAHVLPPPPKRKVATRTPLPRPAPPQSKAAATPPPVSGTATAIPDPGNTPGKSIPAPVANKSATATDVTGSTGAVSPPAPEAKPSTTEPKAPELKPTVIVPAQSLE
jgi:hypothetical protein